MDFGTKCRICGDDIPFEDPLIFVKVDSPNGGRFKTPACSDCVGSDWNVWGAGTRWLSGRCLVALPCSVCGRQMLLYWVKGDSVLCSGWCRREAHREYNARLRRACK